MTFYKLIDYETGEELYVNPKQIEYYVYNDNNVLIETPSLRMVVFKSDFLNMMILEGAQEY